MGPATGTRAEEIISSDLKFVNEIRNDSLWPSRPIYCNDKWNLNVLWTDIIALAEKTFFTEVLELVVEAWRWRLIKDL